MDGEGGKGKIAANLRRTAGTEDPEPENRDTETWEVAESDDPEPSEPSTEIASSSAGHVEILDSDSDQSQGFE